MKSNYRLGIDAGGTFTDFVLADSLRSGRLHPLLTSYQEPPLGVFALYPSGRQLALKMRVLIDFLVTALQG